MKRRRPSEDIELVLLLDAIYQRFHYDFRQLLRWRRSSAEARAGAAPLRLRYASRALQERLSARAGGLPAALQLSDRAGERLVPRPLVLHDASAEKIVPLPAAPIRRSRSGSRAARPARRRTRSPSCSGRRDSRPDAHLRDRHQPRSLRAAEAGIYHARSLPDASAKTTALPGQGVPVRSTTPPLWLRGASTARFDKSIVFSDHSLATDSVFAEVQLVSCRNVLIYFDRGLQDRALGVLQGFDRPGDSWASAAGSPSASRPTPPLFRE